jgi:hypothetical protein
VLPLPLIDPLAVPSRLGGGGGGRSLAVNPFRAIFEGDEDAVEVALCRER